MSVTCVSRKGPFLKAFLQRTEILTYAAMKCDATSAAPKRRGELALERSRTALNGGLAA